MSRSTFVSHDREAFLKGQLSAIQKALNKIEAPLKQKHARALIVGTHREKSAGFFWNHVARIQLEKHPVLTWKFCHLLHKLLRDGHSSVVKDSYKYISRIKQLAAFWQHLHNPGFGVCNTSYAKMLVRRLTFLTNHPTIPGNLTLTANELTSLITGDINDTFQLAVEMLDEMDELMTLQAVAYDCVESMRFSSLIPQGQCLLAPLILVILDTSKFYDYLVKIIFKLHAALPADVLSGHRQRFNQLFVKVKKFYEDASKMQFFKYQASIPPIPQNPPDFLVATEFNSYQTPHAYLKGEELDNVSSGDTQSNADDSTTIIDLNFDDSASMVAGNSAANMPSNFNTLFHSIPEPPAQDDRDIQIANLQREIEEMKNGRQRIINEAKNRFDQYENRVSQAQSEIDFHKNLVDEQKEEVSRLKAATQEVQIHAQNANVEEYEKKVQAQETKFNKMREIYNKLREDHIKTLTEMGSAKNSNMDLQEQLAKKEEKLKGNVSDFDELNGQLAKSQIEIENYQSQLNDLVSEKEQALAGSKQTHDNEINQLFRGICEGSITVLKNNKDSLNNASSITYPSHLVLEQYEQLEGLLDNFKSRLEDSNSITTKAQIAALSTELSHAMAEILMNTASAAYTSSIEHFEPVYEECSQTTQFSINFFEALKKPNLSEANAAFLKMKSGYWNLKNKCEKLPSAATDVSAEEVGSQLEEEMTRMDKAIRAAVEAIEALQQKSKDNNRGVKLEVNSKILETCNDLMNSIQILIMKSRDVQQEIVMSGRGSGSPKDFYKKNHQWTEGLLSAAQAVGVQARVLVASADGVITETGKHEHLIVAATQLAGSIAQLFVSSRVKSDKDSHKLAELGIAVKSVNKCTANVVAATKSGQKTLNDEKLLDFTHLSLHEAKKEEMESQVRTLELEAELQRERSKLSQLRKQHYHMASLVAAENNNPGK
uniref:ENTH domain-containing protein n=1 Tax=Rhabditophanes sp. KR3021 TaxID=114890 RepID=A0AC35TQV0_9BILA